MADRPKKYGNHATAKFHVGTAGWSYLRWDREFYPPSIKTTGKLAYYATRFNAVELNNSFYRLPLPGQFSEWEAKVPENFIFAVKAPRLITHTKKLEGAQKTLPPLINALSVQKKAGPVFFQLPPSLKIDTERLKRFLSQLQRERRYAIEFKDVSWHTHEIYDLLKANNVAFCLFDTQELISPRILTADFAYVRLLGRKCGKHDRFLAEWHNWLLENTKESYVFFHNREEKRLSFGNALAFQELVKKGSMS